MSVPSENETLLNELVSLVEGEEKGGLINSEAYWLLNYVCIVSTLVISIFGIATNVINLATFVRMGFRDTINISLTALASTDFASLICLLWSSICFFPSFEKMLSSVIAITEADFVTVSMVKAYLSMVAGFITCLIAVQRCLCVMMPLRVKMIITKNRLVPVLFAIFILTWSLFLPVALHTRLDWVFRPEKNRTLISLVLADGFHNVTAICFGAMVGLYVTTYAIVFVSTVIIVWKLASQSAWRAKRTPCDAQQSQANGTRCDTEDGPGTGKKSTALSGRDQRATKTVSLIASMYIVCYFPGIVTLLTMSLVPEFNAGMRYHNVYSVIWSIVYIAEGVCSSANIVVYLRTSIKFKQAFLSLFRFSKNI